MIARVVVLALLSTAVFAERFGLEHIGKIVGVVDPQISPDGRSVVILLRRVNYKDNRYDIEMVQVDVATKAQKSLSKRQASRVRWSPDGTKLAFLAPVEGKAQVFILPIDGGEAVQVSKSTTAVQSYNWRPDGKAFAYTAPEEAAKREGEEKANRSFEADVDYLLTESPRSNHLWLVPAEGGDGKRLTSGEWSIGGEPFWSPDAQKIAFIRQPGPGMRFAPDTASYVLDVESGSIVPLSGRKNQEQLIGFSSDGRNIAYTWPRDGDTRFVRELWVAPASGGLGRNLTRAMDTNAGGAWMPDGRSLLLRVPRGTKGEAWIQPLEGAPRKLEGGPMPGTVAKSGRMAYLDWESNRPLELYVKDSPESAPRRLTDFNAPIAALEMGKQEAIRWRGPDNFDMDGVLTYPPGYQAGRPYPLVLQIHGGPRGASMLGFSERSQWLASHGWIIFEPNYRGSSNGGNAFQAAIWNDAGAGPGRDVMSGVDLLIKKGIADPARMAVSGWSYGGYMTVWLLGNYPDRWRAGVAGAAVTDHVDQYVLSDIHSFVATYYGGSPFTDPKRLQAYRDQAPITYASRIKAPTLVLCDTGDQRVPITESFILYHVLRDNGVETKFIAYPVSGHFPSDPIHQRDVNRRWAEWIKERIEPKERTSR
jgi:dipeptidyl aminopeptidase/acylaminoacyl peptidase